MNDLADKKCKPCEGGTPPLVESEVGEFMKKLPEGWRVQDGKKLEKEFSFKNFLKAMAFVDRVADVAESEDHHPDIYIHYNKVRIELWTHAIDGLSENDFIVASKIEAMQRIFIPLEIIPDNSAPS